MYRLRPNMLMFIIFLLSFLGLWFTSICIVAGTLLFGTDVAVLTVDDIRQIAFGVAPVAALVSFLVALSLIHKRRGRHNRRKKNESTKHD